MVPTLAIGSPFQLVDVPPSCLISQSFLTFCTTRRFMLTFHLPVPALEPTISPRNAGSFCWRIMPASEHCDSLNSASIPTLSTLLSSLLFLSKKDKLKTTVLETSMCPCHNGGHEATQFFQQKECWIYSGATIWLAGIVTLSLGLHRQDIVSKGNCKYHCKWEKYASEHFTIISPACIFVFPNTSAGKWFRLLYYKKEACFLFIFYFPTPPPQGFESEISLCQEEKKVTTFTRTIKTMTHELCRDLRWFPCFENLQRIKQNPTLKGEKESGSWRTSTLAWHMFSASRLDSKWQTVTSFHSTFQERVREKRQKTLKYDHKWSFRSH